MPISIDLRMQFSNKMLDVEELVTTKSPLCETIGKTRINYDFSLDYASYLSCSNDVDKKKTKSENGALTYFLKNGGSVSLRREVTGIGRIVVYYEDCPKRIYDDLQALEEKIVDIANDNYGCGLKK